MRVTSHRSRGFELKEYLVARLSAAGHDVRDHGPAEYDAEDDYPPFCTSVGEAVVAEPGSLGVVIGGSGNGEQIAANKVPGVRAALAWNHDTAVLARQHNDANVISIGARQHSADEAAALVDAFLAEPFSGRGAPPAADRPRRRLRAGPRPGLTHRPPAREAASEDPAAARRERAAERRGGSRESRTVRSPDHPRVGHRGQRFHPPR